MKKQTVDHCIRHEGKYRNVGVYVVVVMDEGCPVEVQVTLAHPPSQNGMERFDIRSRFADLEKMTNAWLACGAHVDGLVRMLKNPPCEMSGIIGDALIAAMEAE